MVSLITVQRRTVRQREEPNVCSHPQIVSELQRHVRPITFHTCFLPWERKTTLGEISWACQQDTPGGRRRHKSKSSAPHPRRCWSTGTSAKSPSQHICLAEAWCTILCSKRCCSKHIDVIRMLVTLWLLNCPYLPHPADRNDL